ncbi:hypothetical protein [Oryzobacter terrae]
MFLGPSYRSGVNTVDENGTATVSFDEARGVEGLREAVSFIDGLPAATT